MPLSLLLVGNRNKNVFQLQQRVKCDDTFDKLNVKENTTSRYLYKFFYVIDVFETRADNNWLHTILRSFLFNNFTINILVTSMIKFIFFFLLHFILILLRITTAIIISLLWKLSNVKASHFDLTIISSIYFALCIKFRKRNK